MEKNGGVEVLNKSLEILNYLSDRKATGVTDISRALDLPKSTAYRILETLASKNVLVKNSEGKYSMGPSVLLWSSGYRLSSGLVDLARPYLEKLRDASRETVHLCVYESGVVQYVDRLESPQTVVLRWSRLGSELPLYCTAAGRAILAALTPGEVDDYLKSHELTPRTERTVTSPDELKKMLKLFRVQGYSEENEENEENIRCIGAAIIGRDGRPFATVSLTAPSFRFDDDKAAEFGPLVARTAAEISRAL